MPARCLRCTPPQCSAGYPGYPGGHISGSGGNPSRLPYIISRSTGRPDQIQQPSYDHNQSSGASETVPEEFREKYILRRMLGRGSFGTVRSVIDKNTGLEWAAKIMPKRLAGKDPQRILTRIREEVPLFFDPNPLKEQRFKAAQNISRFKERNLLTFDLTTVLIDLADFLSDHFGIAGRHSQKTTETARDP